MYFLSRRPDLQDHISGSLEAPVILVEYGDYECPQSLAAFDWVKKLQNEFSQELCYVFRHYPLTDIHPHSALAAAAAEAAGVKNKFWEMHELLFTRQDYLSIGTITEMAQKLELHEEEFLYNINREDILGRIDQDMISGEESGVLSPPAFFFNGIRLEGPISHLILRENVMKTLAGQILSA